LFWQLIRRAASRADCTAGSNKPTITPMIAMTTNNSTSVKPVLRTERNMKKLPKEREERKEGGIKR
jgi:hypothetical protein